MRDIDVPLPACPRIKPGKEIIQRFNSCNDPDTQWENICILMTAFKMHRPNLVLLQEFRNDIIHNDSGSLAHRLGITEYQQRDSISYIKEFAKRHKYFYFYVFLCELHKEESNKRNIGSRPYELSYYEFRKVLNLFRNLICKSDDNDYKKDILIENSELTYNLYKYIYCTITQDCAFKKPEVITDEPIAQSSVNKEAREHALENSIKITVKNPENKKFNEYAESYVGYIMTIIFATFLTITSIIIPIDNPACIIPIFVLSTVVNAVLQVYHYSCWKKKPEQIKMKYFSAGIPIWISVLIILRYFYQAFFA